MNGYSQLIAEPPRPNPEKYRFNSMYLGFSIFAIVRTFFKAFLQEIVELYAMSDPFAPSSHDQLMREAQRGMAIFAVLMAVLAYVAFDRFAGRNRLPEHVRNAPIAQTVWPYANEAPDSASRQAARQHAREQTEPDNELEQRADSAETNSGSSGSIGRVEPAAFQAELRRQSDVEVEKVEQPFQPNKPSVLNKSTARDFAPLSDNRLPPLLSDKPFPHTSVPLSASHSIPSPISLIDSKAAPDTEPSRPKKEIAKKTNSDFPVDPFEASVPNESTVPLNHGANHKNDQATRTLGHFSPSPSPFPSQSVPTTVLNSTQGSAAINALDVREPQLFAPNPMKVPAKVESSNQSELPVKPPTLVDRTSATKGLGSFEVASEPGKLTDQLVPATKLQVGDRKQATRHLVAEGDSYYFIAQYYYGDGNYFRALWQFNEIKRPTNEDLLVGSEIEIPTIEQLEIDYPNEVPTRTWSALPSSTFVAALNTSSKTTKPKEASNSNQDFSAPIEAADNDCDSQSSATAKKENSYKTKQGETLFEIAANELGQASRYLEIMEANRERLPDDISDSTPLPANLKLFIPK